jgi:hypothetical protein
MVTLIVLGTILVALVVAPLCVKGGPVNSGYKLYR